MHILITSLIFSLYLYGNVQGDIYVNGGPTPPRSNQLQDVYLRFYNGSSVNEYVQLPLSEANNLLTVIGFDPNGYTTFYSHGYMSSPDSDNVMNMYSAYLDTHPDFNFVAVDWSNMNQGDYLSASLNVRKVGRELGNQIDILVDNGLVLNNIHLVGHSLGSHIVGYAARRLKTTHQKTLKRITGLDPAFPIFYPGSPLTEHISATDAEFVDIIHSNAGQFGTPFATGTADFWPNAADPIQPGCIELIPTTIPGSCSHGRAWQYYAESVRAPLDFPASPANSYLQFKFNPTPEVGMTYMGYGCPPNVQGNFYLVTNSSPPFGKGQDGIHA